MFPKADPRRSHGTVTSNLVRHLGNALDGSPCRVFHEGMKVQIADEAILYPDLFVTCDKADLATEMLFKAPTLVIEVLSPANEGYERSRKFALYRRLPSLKEYVLMISASMPPASWPCDARHSGVRPPGWPGA